MSTELVVTGYDQFSHAMTITSADGITWSSAMHGTFSNIGVDTATYTAPKLDATSIDTIKVENSEDATKKFTASMDLPIVVYNYLYLTDAELAKLTKTLYSNDKMFSRNDMLAVFSYFETEKDNEETDSTIDALDLADLHTILNNAKALNMPNYVYVLASDVVDGNVANTHYQGETWSNLEAGSSNLVMEVLVDKWFYGTDLPDASFVIDGATVSYSYETIADGATLFGTAGKPSHIDLAQGILGDCYFLATMGAIADSNPDAISDMITTNTDANGNFDGTWTVRFYSNGVADYVTVNNTLVVDDSNNLVLQGHGTSIANNNYGIWLSLLEKAYAQWNETGKTGQDVDLNSYTAIEGGWTVNTMTQVLGKAATNFTFTTSTAKQMLINALSKHKAVTIGTFSNYVTDTTTNIHGSHAYVVLGYDAKTGTFQLYNPWGFDQPKAVKWSQLKAVCYMFTVADATVATPMSSDPINKALTAAAISTVAHSSTTTRYELKAISVSSDEPAKAVVKTSGAAVDALLTQNARAQSAVSTFLDMADDSLDFVSHASSTDNLFAELDTEFAAVL
jgi:hypothetical protein